MNTITDPTQAVLDRDSVALFTSLTTLEEATTFRNDVLPRLSPADCRWFWQVTMQPSMLEETMAKVREICLAIADQNWLELGKDFSLGCINDLPTMVLRPKHVELFYDAIPIERHSVLRFYLQPV